MCLGIINGIGSIVGSIIGGPVKRYQELRSLKISQKHEIQTLKHKAVVAKENRLLKAAEEGQAQDYDLDKIAMRNMENSWKDEVVLIIFLAPIVLAFTPWGAGIVTAGFKAIEEMPEWYVAIVIGMVVVIYGLRGLLKAYLQRSFVISKPSKKA